MRLKTKQFHSNICTALQACKENDVLRICLCVCGIPTTALTAATFRLAKVDKWVEPQTGGHNSNEHVASWYCE